MVFTAEIKCRTRGEDDMLDLTGFVARELNGSGISNGIVCLFVVGSTAALTTIEFEPGLQKDFPRTMEQIAPKNAHYEHEATWNDDNGHSHVRASLIGPGLTIPLVNGHLTLGTWQQVVLLEMDTRARDRRVVVQVMGE